MSSMIRTDRILLRKRAYPALAGTLETLRVLYNAALEQRILAWHRQHISLSFYDQCKGLTELRSAEPPWSVMPVDMVRMTVLRRVDLAFKAFFRRCKSGETPGFPRFKGRGRFDTLVFGTRGWKIEGRRLHLRGIGSFSFTGGRRRDGRVLGLHLRRVADRWEAQILVDVGPAPAVRPAERGVGIDVGIRTFATLSDGTRIEHPRFMRQSLDELAAAQRSFSRKKRGSVGRAKAKASLGRLHRRIANRRRDFLHQETRRLVNKYDGFAVEKLDVQEMAQQTPEGMEGKKGRGLHRGIMDSAWSTFGFMLAYKAEEAGRPVVKVDPRGTSKRCSGCGTPVRKTLRDRIHECPACGLVLDRDENAARNIRDLGWRSAEDPGGRTVDRLGSCGGSR